VAPAFGTIAVVVLSVSAAAAAAVTPAPAVGVGLGASPISLAGEAQPGGTYRLPDLYVVNTGSATSFYRVRVEELNQGEGRKVPPTWIIFTRNDFVLRAKGSTSVASMLSVPAGAHPGKYVSDFVVGTVASSRGHGVVAGAQAATKLIFTVGRHPDSGSPWSWPWWAYLVIIGGVVIVLVTVLLRRSGIRLRIERRR
jgi:hypothetical protein